MSDPDDVCTEKNICDHDPRIAHSEIDWSSSDSLHNWYDKLDLKCVPGWKVGLISSLSFIGSLVTLPWVPRLADKYGRKPLVFITNIFQTIGYTMVMFTHSLYVMIAAAFIYGMTSGVQMAVGFPYLLELVPQRHTTRVTSVLWIIDQFAYLVMIIYFWLISKEWFWVVLIGYIL